MRIAGPGRVAMAAAALAALSATAWSAPAAPESRDGANQTWYGSPVLPGCFQEAQDDEREKSAPEFRLPLPLTRIPVEARSSLPPIGESDFPRLLSVLDLEGWRRADELRYYRERAGDVFFGIPLLIPQLLIEECVPRGLAIGPTTFLYRTSKDSKSMPLVVFDQALFHEAEFLAQVQSEGNALAYSENLSHSQRHVLRRSLMSGFRATYSLPSMSLDHIREAAAEQGIWGYLLAPAAGGTLLFLKGVDQKFSIEDVVKARIQLSSGRQWLRGDRSPTGLPAMSLELKFADLPVALIVSFEMSNHGMLPQFIGLGSSLG